MFKQYTIPIFVPHLGCNYDCVFCNQVRITGKSTTVSGADVISTIEEYLSYFDKAEDRRLEVGFFGGSFTGIEPKIQEELLSIAYDYKTKGKIQGIRLSTRPDFIDMETIERLKKYGVDIVELGVQSMTQEVLDAAGRGHKVKDVYDAAKMLKDNGIGLGLQMMVGLPKDTIEKSRHTALEFIKMKPECVRIYPTLVIKDTQLEKLYLRGKFKPIDFNTSIDGVSDFLMMFELNDINVIRVGLQPTDNMQLGKDIVAGPFHPSYGQFALSKIYLKIIEEALVGVKTNEKNLKILANNKYISAIAGQKSSNKKYLLEKYGFKNVVFQGADIDNKDLILEIEDVQKVLKYKESIKLYLDKKIKTS